MRQLQAKAPAHLTLSFKIQMAKHLCQCPQVMLERREEVKTGKEVAIKEAEDMETEVKKSETKEAEEEQKTPPGQPGSENQPLILRDAEGLYPKDLPRGEVADLELSKQVTKAYRSVVKRLPLKYSFTQNKDGLYSLWQMECAVAGMSDADTLRVRSAEALLDTRQFDDEGIHRFGEAMCEEAVECV